MHKTLKNKYQILKKTYNAILGEIYQCHDSEDPQNQKIVKVITKKLNQKKTFVTDHIKKLIQTQHQNIIKIYDCFEQDDISTEISTQQYLTENSHNNIYIILEKIDLKPIEQYISIYGPQQIEKIYQTIKNTMQYLHDIDINEYKISNQSVFVDDHQNIKIVDFMFQYLVTRDFSELKQKQDTQLHQLNQLDISISMGNDIFQQNLWNLGIILLSFISGRKIAKSEQQNFLEQKHLKQFLNQLADNTIFFQPAVQSLVKSKSDQRQLISLKKKSTKKQFKLKKKQTICIIILFILGIGFTVYALTSFGINQREALYKKGYQKYFAGSYSQAEKILNKLIKIDPNYSQAYYYRAKSKEKLMKFNQAIEDYNTLISMEPERGDLYYNRGVIQQKLQKFEEAFADFKKAVELQKKQQYQLKKESLSKHLKKNQQSAIHVRFLI